MREFHQDNEGTKGVQWGSLAAGVDAGPAGAWAVVVSGTRGDTRAVWHRSGHYGEIFLSGSAVDSGRDLRES